MHTASLGENTHREQCRFSNKRFFGKGSTTENRESRHKVHREMHPFEQKEEKKRILIIGSTASDRADASFYPNTARNQSRWIDNRATHLSPTLLSSVHFLFVPSSLINAQQKRENVQINGRFGAPLINRRRAFSFNKETSRRRGRRV